MREYIEKLFIIQAIEVIRTNNKHNLCILIGVARCMRIFKQEDVVEMLKVVKTHYQEKNTDDVRKILFFKATNKNESDFFN